MVNRRTLLSGLAAGFMGVIGAVLAVLTGGAVLSPRLAARQDDWIDAGSLETVGSDAPVEVALARVRQDGYRVIRDRAVVYVVRAGDRVRAFSATCTHLGCRVSWQPAEGEFRCPCHGGRFAPDGSVIGGPPPRGLDELPARVEGTRVMVRI